MYQWRVSIPHLIYAPRGCAGIRIGSMSAVQTRIPRKTRERVLNEIYDKKEGWLPLFGANSRGDFVGMPTCWPFDERSNPIADAPISMMLDIDLLLQKKTFEEIKTIAENDSVYSIPGVTFMSALSDRNGNVLHIIPGQGYKYYEKPEFAEEINGRKYLCIVY